MNWGTGITITLTIFILFIIGLVYGTTTASPELVAPDYYAQELVYESVVRAKSNASAYHSQIDFQVNESKLAIACEPCTGTLKGEVMVSLKRPNDSRLDGTHALVLREGLQHVDQTLLPGFYLVNLSWERNDEPYRIERTIHVGAK